MNNSVGNQHLQLTAEIWKNEENSPTPAKEERVQIVTNDELPILDIKTSWSSEGYLQFSVYGEKVQQLKYVIKESTQTPGTYHAIPSRVLNHLAKLTSQKNSIHYEGVEKSTPTTQTPSVRQALHLIISRLWEIYGVIRMRSWI